MIKKYLLILLLSSVAFFSYAHMNPFSFFKNQAAIAAPIGPSAATSTITGTGPVVADGVATSTITITLRDASSQPVSGVTPTFSATDAVYTNIAFPCSISDASGISTCTLSSNIAQTKLLQIDTPIFKTGGTVTFTAAPTTIYSSTGGTISTVGDYRIHKFTASGTFTSSAPGEIEYLVVGGGASGGHSDIFGGHGGQVKAGNMFIQAEADAITIGAGGAGSELTENPGTATSLASYVTSLGGHVTVNGECGAVSWTYNIDWNHPTCGGFGGGP